MSPSPLIRVFSDTIICRLELRRLLPSSNEPWRGILQGIPHVHVYIDDILVADSTEKEHLVTLEKVMSRLGECGIKLKRTKCKFMLPSVGVSWLPYLRRGNQPY